MGRPRFLIGILLVSVTAVAVLPLYTSFYLHPSFTRLLTEQTAQEAVRVASHLASTRKDSGPLGRESITQELQEDISRFISDFGLQKVKVFAPSGEIVYSSEQGDVGGKNTQPYFREIVAKGEAHTNVTRRDRRTLEGETMPVDVVETYVPVMSGGMFLGAFEIYYNITAGKRQLDTLISRSSGLVYVVTLLLLAAVAIALRSAHRTVSERDRAEEDLREHKNRLEEIVQERTTELVEANSRLAAEINDRRGTEEKYRSLVESTGDSIYLVDAAFRYLFVNQTHLNRMGFPEVRFLGRPYGAFHTPEETEAFIEHVDRVFASGESVQHEHRSRRDGRCFLRTLSPVKDRHGTTVAVTVVSKDITEHKLMAERLEILSLTDELTGLFNRRGFFTLAEQQLKLAPRLNRQLLLISADLDRLKAINDTLGHQAGDRALVETAGILRETFRGSDVIARIGGDEFTVLQFARNGDGAGQLAERLRLNLARWNQAAERRFSLSLSVGIAAFDAERHRTIDDLLANADQIMYGEKRNRRQA